MHAALLLFTQLVSHAHTFTYAQLVMHMIVHAAHHHDTVQALRARLIIHITIIHYTLYI
jgi:hypothetical protein